MVNNMSKPEKPQRIYISKVTGTWGYADEIVIVDAPKLVLDYLNTISDSEIADFAEKAETLRSRVSIALIPRTGG